MTPLQKLIEQRLNVSLVKWLYSLRSEKKSYRDISVIIQEETGIKVSKSSIAAWLNVTLTK